MSRIAYVNGRYLPHRDASVHIEDRGYQFADGVYEVFAFMQGQLVDEDYHLERLKRSLSELRIALPCDFTVLKQIFRRVIAKNRIANGILYLQITRGVARRDHPFPKKATPSLVLTVKQFKPLAPEIIEKGVAVITFPDLRWKRCDIKSVALLPNVLAKQAAKEKGAYEAWLIDEKGLVTEGSSTNAWIVSPEGELLTRNLGPEILGGVTRRMISEIAQAKGFKISERAFSLAEALKAKEAFLTSTSTFVLPVIKIDDHLVNNGKPGPLSLELRRLYAETL